LITVSDKSNELLKTQIAAIVAVGTVHQYEIELQKVGMMNPRLKTYKPGPNPRKNSTNITVQTYAKNIAHINPSFVLLLSFIFSLLQQFSSYHSRILHINIFPKVCPEQTKKADEKISKGLFL